MKTKILILSLLTLILSGCGQSVGDGKSSSGYLGSGNFSQNNVKIQISNDVLTITGIGFKKASFVTLVKNGIEYKLSILNKTDETIRATLSENLKFAVREIFSLVIGNAYGDTTINATFTLMDGSVTNPKLAPRAVTLDKISGPLGGQGVLVGQTLKWSGHEWIASDSNSVSYRGAWNASTNFPDINNSPSQLGDFYIVSNSGTADINGISTWSNGDWIIYGENGWERITNTTLKGDKGDVGPMGPQGLQGLTGLTGPQGPKGDQGVAGLNGDIGPMGPQGLIGPHGVQGLKGDQGIQGEIGLTGSKGDKGDIGPMGPQGPAGLNGTDVLSTTLSGFSQIISSIVTGSDTVLSALEKLQSQILFMDSTKLDKTGGTLVTGTINGVPNPMNPDDVANKAYVDSISMTPGPQGLTGPQGPTGVAGPIGPQGLPGANGLNGDVGPMGPQGIQGPIGLTGLQGPKGDKGDPGTNSMSASTDSLAEGSVNFYFTQNRVINSLAGSTIAGIKFPLTSMETMTIPLDPQFATDVANKRYVDNLNTLVQSRVDIVTSSLQAEITRRDQEILALKARLTVIENYISNQGDSHGKKRKR